MNAYLIMALVMIGLAASDNAFADEAIADEAIVEAFRQAHRGFSSDEVLLQDDLREAYLGVLADSGSRLTERDALLKLLRLRKAGKLPVQTTRRADPVPDRVTPIAEIATRVVTDRHRVSTDELLATPRLRDELLKEARKLDSEISGYHVRKSCLQLRKKRALRPELVLRVAQWKRTVVTYSLDELRDGLASKQIATCPGVYLFRHPLEGYLYIGEAADLNARLSEHLAGSDRASLASFLSTHDESSITVEMHMFPRESPAKEVAIRRAYESELIRSREPKFNVRP